MTRSRGVVVVVLVLLVGLLGRHALGPRHADSTGMTGTPAPLVSLSPAQR